MVGPICKKKLGGLNHDFAGSQHSGQRAHKARRLSEAHSALRQERSLPVLAEFYTWLTALAGRVLPKSPVGQAIHYVLPRWEGLTRYCEDGALAIDNNLAERTLRPCAIGRKNWLFLGNDRGGRTAAVLFSFHCQLQSESGRALGLPARRDHAAGRSAWFCGF